MKKFYCDACDSAFEAEKPESGMPKCPKCESAGGVSEKESAGDGVIDDLAHQAATSPRNDLPNPTPAQVKSGSYRKGHFTIAGLDVAIENPEGSERKGIGPDGKPWVTTLKAHYGYIKRTRGADGEHVDVFVKPETPPDYNGPIWIVDQLDAFGYFDEHKVLIGWEEKESAKAGYFENYGADWPKKRLGDIYALDPVGFASWLEFPPPHRYYGPVATQDGGVSFDAVAADSVLRDEVDEAAEVLGCDAKDGLCRLRQFAMQCDAINSNDNIYPRAVALAAIREARLRAKAGAMLSELEHPAIVKACDRGKCGDHFTEDAFGKTARVDDIEDPDAKGRVYIVRTILDTPAGRFIKKRVDAGEPVGISTRYGFSFRRAEVGGRKARIADSMTIFTFDDVKNPAVQGAGAYTLLGDSELKDLGEPFTGEVKNTGSPEETPLVEETESDGDSTTTRRTSAQGQEATLKNILKALRAFSSEVQTGACADSVNAAHKLAADAICAAYQEGEHGEEFKTAVRGYQKLCKDAVEKISGFQAGKESPYAIVANQLGSEPEATGWAPDVADPNMVNASTPITPTTKTMLHADADPETKALLDWAKGKKNEEAIAADAKVKADAIDEGITELLAGDHELKSLPQAVQDETLGLIRSIALGKDDVLKIADKQVAFFSKLAADAKLVVGTGGAAGNLVLNRFDPMSRAASTVLGGPIPVMASVEKLIAGVDDFMAHDPRLADEYGWVNASGDSATAKDEQRRRKENMRLAMPILEQTWGMFCTNVAERGQTLSADSFTEDSALREMQTVMQSLSGDSAAYNTVLTNLLNQPTLMMWLLTQAFHDMHALEFASPIGPGQQVGGKTEGWQDFQPFGRVFRVPSETWTDPTGHPSKYGVGPQDLLYNTENAGIVPGTPSIYWDTFGSDWRMIAIANALQSLTAIGLGPLNYPAIARGLYHMAARKCRSVDVQIMNEIMASALEFGAVAVTTEAYTDGGVNGLDLDSNSVGPASGLVTVNLNPQKTAVATVAAADKSVTYGTTVKAALRLKAGGGNGAAAVAGTYCSLNQVGPTPIVPPRSLLNLNAIGTDSTSTRNAFTVTVPASQVQGWLDNNGDIQNNPGTTATFAVDWINGVVVFNNTLSDLTLAGGTIETSITVAPYSYATNFDYFTLGLGNIGQISLATGEKYQDYYSRMLGQIDDSAAVMADSPNYVRPDLALWGMKTSAKIIQATIHFKLASPDGTELFPDETHFSRRNGVNMARFNAQAWWKDKAGVILRRGTTRYAINKPADIRGPVTLFDSNGQVIPGEAYWMAENSSICTPMVKDLNGAIVNPVSRAVLTY